MRRLDFYFSFILRAAPCLCIDTTRTRCSGQSLEVAGCPPPVPPLGPLPPLHQAAATLEGVGHA